MATSVCPCLWPSNEFPTSSPAADRIRCRSPAVNPSLPDPAPPHPPVTCQLQLRPVLEENPTKRAKRPHSSPERRPVTWDSRFRTVFTPPAPATTYGVGGRCDEGRAQNKEVVLKVKADLDGSKSPSCLPCPELANQPPRSHSVRVGGRWRDRAGKVPFWNPCTLVEVRTKPGQPGQGTTTSAEPAQPRPTCPTALIPGAVSAPPPPSPHREDGDGVSASLWPWGLSSTVPGSEEVTHKYLLHEWMKQAKAGGKFFSRQDL